MCSYKILIRLIVFFCVSLIAFGTGWAHAELKVERARKSVTLGGYTRARTQQNLISEAAGKVIAVNYDVGMRIGKAPFLEIDTTFIDFQIEQTHLTLEKLNVARARGTSQIEFLKKEFQRIDTLRQDKVATVSRWEAVSEELAQARLSVQTTEVELKILESQIRELKERRSRYRIFAPADWMIVQRQVERGEIIAAGTQLGIAADFTRLVVPMYVSGQELAALRQIEAITVIVDGRPVRAEINWINPEFDERTRKSAIELALVDHRGDSRGGLPAELKLELPAGGLMVPKAAVTNRFDNPHVVLKATGAPVPIAILGESGAHLLIADHAALPPGMELQSGPTSSSTHR